MHATSALRTTGLTAMHNMLGMSAGGAGVPVLPGYLTMQQGSGITRQH